MGRNKRGETEGKGKIVPFQVHDPLFFLSLENILIPVFFTLGNKGTQPDCGRERVIRSSGNSTEGKSEIQKSLGLNL